MNSAPPTDAVDEFGDDELISPAVAAQAQQAFIELARLRDVIIDEWGLTGKFQSPVSIHWHDAMSTDDFANRFADSLRKAAADASSLQAGRVYCYACRSSACEHSAPPATTAVFAGYEGNGKPAWMEFFNYLLSLDNERIDSLFAEQPMILSQIVGRKRLISQQLVAFGRNSMTYRVIGQIVSGYFRIRGCRFAVTAQVVELADHSLHLQTIVSSEVQSLLADDCVASDTVHGRVHDALKTAKAKIDLIGSLWGHGKDKTQRQELVGRIFITLRHLANSLEQKGRQYHRRTMHAEERWKVNRPIHKASDDLQLANDHDFFRDTVTDSIVIIGKHGRSHVFSSSGKLITSMVLPANQRERRWKRKRYTPLTGDELKLFRATATA